jgi:hypothetical protein
MVNSQNIAVLSEKVAALEAALKNAGVVLPEVTSSDNGKALQVVNGAWATGDNIYDLIKIKTVSHIATVAAGATSNWNPMTDDIAITGYTPIGVIGFKFNNVSIKWVNFSIEDSDYGMLVTNTSNASVTQTFTYNVLYIKSAQA